MAMKKCDECKTLCGGEIVCETCGVFLCVDCAYKKFSYSKSEWVVYCGACREDICGV
jgi:hypothetical protein